ncbi:MAG: hypothetical protein RRY20_07475, partial [Bilophila sp.]
VFQKHHSGEKRRFPQNPRRVAAAAALASAEHFQSENALTKREQHTFESRIPLRIALLKGILL